MGWYLFLANAMAIVHGGFVFAFLIALVFSLLGRMYVSKSALVIFWAWIVGKIISYVWLGACIFTLAEQRWRVLAGEKSYEEGFIKHYLGQIGISVSDTFVFWAVVTPVTIFILSEAYWHNRRRYG